MRLFFGFSSLVCVAFFLFTTTDRSGAYIPGSYRALDMFSYIRAYPGSDIPSAAYTRGYERHLKIKSEQSVQKNRAGEWEAMGPLNTAGRALTIAVNPQEPNTVYMGSASGGLWRSRTLGLGKSWEYVPTGFPVLGVSSIAFAEGDSTIMYIGTGEVYNFFSTGTDGAFRSTRGSYGIGILKSEDGGRSWTKSLDWSYQQNHGVWMVKVSPLDPDVVYAATTQGVYKTENGGFAWRKVLDVIMCTDIEIDPRDDRRVIASCGNFGTAGRGIYRTVDGGENWIETEAGPWFNFQGKILLARAESDPNVVYASVGNGFGFDDGATWLLRTSDNGRNWDVVNDFDYSKWQGWFSHDIAVHPENEDEIIAVGIDILKSTNGGRDLVQKTTGGVVLGTPPVDEADGGPSYSHSDHHFVMYHPQLEDVVLFGNDGGMFVSFDGGETVRSANGGLQTTQFYNGFSVSNANPEFAMGGLQDNSTVIFRGDGAWQRAIGGDGSWSAINQRNDNVVFGSYQNLNILKSLNNGSQFFNSGIPFRPNEAPLFISPYVISDSDAPVMYAGGRYIYRSDNLAANWQATNAGLPLNGDPAFCMDVYDPDPDIIYVGTVGFFEQPEVFVSVDGGNNWTGSEFGFPDRIPNDIAVHPFDPSVAYVCFSGFGTDHLFKTSDFGKNWIPLGSELPDVPYNAVALDPADPSIIYLGSDIGVYVSTDEGMQWENFGEGLPEALIVMDITVSPEDRKLWLASHGNGTYRADMLSSIVDTEEAGTDSFNPRVFPNPASTVLRMSGLPSESEWQILNMDGQLLQKGTRQTVDVSSLTGGLYIIRFQMEGVMHIKTFVKI